MIALGILYAGSIGNAMTLITNLANQHGVFHDAELYAQIQQGQGSERMILTKIMIAFLRSLATCNNNQVATQATDELESFYEALGESIARHREAQV